MMQLKKDGDGYLEFVQSEAEKQHKLFMLDSGEGRDFEDTITGWYVEDLSGWLIDTDQKERFLKERENNNINDTFKDTYVFVKWFKKENGETGINFMKYPC
ncbi:MAG TPA: hypothetical protein DDW50_14855 [Firmicutes bacterium]|jgi:hypothetical protein|nr:hypothetical protein [Bacillota bacterium]